MRDLYKEARELALSGRQMRIASRAGLDAAKWDDLVSNIRDINIDVTDGRGALWGRIVSPSGWKNYVAGMVLGNLPLDMRPDIASEIADLPAGTRFAVVFPNFHTLWSREMGQFQSLRSINVAFIGSFMRDLHAQVAETVRQVFGDEADKVKLQFHSPLTVVFIDRAERNKSRLEKSPVGVEAVLPVLPIAPVRKETEEDIHAMSFPTWYKVAALLNKKDSPFPPKSPSDTWLQCMVCKKWAVTDPNPEFDLAVPTFRSFQPWAWKSYEEMDPQEKQEVVILKDAERRGLYVPISHGICGDCLEQQASQLNPVQRQRLLESYRADAARLYGQQAVRPT